MSAIYYRKTTIDDLQTLVDYRVEFLLDFWGEQSQDAIEALKINAESYFEKTLTDDSYVCFLALSDETIAGIGGMIIRQQPGNFKNPTGLFGYLVNMYTIPSFRRKGICSTILEMLIKEGRKRGISAFELHATKEGEPVYQKHGFKIHNEPTYRKYI
jgi:ribosomal protein S18 acetylase RimI-like enzyme